MQWRSCSRLIGLVLAMMVGACSTGYSASNQRVTYITIGNGVAAVRTNVGGSGLPSQAPIAGEIQPEVIREVLHRVSARGQSCFEFANAAGPTYSKPYEPVPGDPVYFDTMLNYPMGWIHQDDLELYCMLYGPAETGTAQTDSRDKALEAAFFDFLTSERGSARWRESVDAIRRVALAAEVYGWNEPYLANVAIELFAPQRLFSRPSHGLDGCGQANCRLFHRTCGNGNPSRWPDQDNLRAYRLFCGIRGTQIMRDLREANY